jgi:aspartyl-tRNA(Asn)/glutamyl-tRNA(Gln) amidotransferase subunit A
VGLKPTYGRVSKYGILPLAWSLDHPGPLTRTVEDAAIILGAIAGWDPKDPATVRTPVQDYRSFLSESLTGLRVGIPKEHFFESVDPGVESAVRDAIDTLEGLGAEVTEIPLPHISYSLAVELAIIFAEATAAHKDNLRSKAELYGHDVRAELDAGEFILATDYIKAQQTRRRILADFVQAFETVDAVASPTIPMTAPKIGEMDVTVAGRIESVLDAIWRFLYQANVTGLPALSVPCGFSGELPVGLQLMGRPFDEGTLLRFGYAYQKATTWHEKVPESIAA